MKYLYPKDLAEYVHWGWNQSDEATGQLLKFSPSFPPDNPPDLSVLEHLLSICYQASLMNHEGEPVSFRLIMAEPDEFEDHAGPPEGMQKLEFTDHRQLTGSELRRLSPAARYSRSMIAIRMDPSTGPMVWGVIHTGPRWLHTNHGGRGTAPPIPARLVIKVVGAGNMEVLKGNRPLVGLSNGRFHVNSLNVFRSTWLHDYFAPVRQERLDIHRQARIAAGDIWADLDPQLSRIIDQYMMKRVIAAMRAFRHGGTLIVVPPERTAMLSQPNPYLTMKYKFADRQARARFRTLIVDVMNTLAMMPNGGKKPVGWQDYSQTADPKIKALDEAIFEMSHLISSLSVADGAVVLTRQFELLGFAAEIHCADSEVTHLAKALDLEGEKYRDQSILDVGTRHRSAYRLCQQLHDALAIVVSQEGTVQFVRWIKKQLMFWEHQGSFDFSTIN